MRVRRSVAGVSNSRRRTRSALRATRTDVGGTPIHAVVGGDGRPVVLLHGLAVSGAYMLPLARVLAGSCSVLVPDLPGQGKSPAREGAWGLSEMAETLGDWLEAIGVDAPLVVANSLGCQVITALACRRPALVGPMVLVGPTTDPTRRGARHQLFDLLRGAGREPLPMVALAARDTLGVDLRPLLLTIRSATADRIEERLPYIEQPTVVVHGEDDRFIGRAWAEHVTALLPHGRLVVIPSEAHTVHYTRPDLVAQIVLQLLDAAPVSAVA